jgi:hypothetical protein
MDWGIAHVIECFPGKYEALSSVREKERERELEITGGDSRGFLT